MRLERLLHCRIMLASVANVLYFRPRIYQNLTGLRSVDIFELFSVTIHQYFDSGFITVPFFLSIRFWFRFMKYSVGITVPVLVQNTDNSNRKFQF